MTKQADKILRVGIIQGGRIIEERLLRKRAPVTVGWSPKNTFVIPVTALPPSFMLFELRSDSYFLNFKEGHKGRISLDDGVVDLATLREQGKARRRGDTFSLSLSDKARGKVVLGEVTLLFQFVTPPPLPPKLKLPAAARGGWLKAVEWSYAGFVLLSALLQVIPATWLILQDFPEPKRTDAMPDRVAQLNRDYWPKMEEKAQEQAEKGTDEAKEEKKEDEVKPDKEKTARADSASKPEDPEAAARAAAERKRALAKAVRGKTLLKFITTQGSDDDQGGGLVDALANGTARTKVDEAFNGAMGVTAATAGMERSRRGGADGDAGGQLATINDLQASGAQRTVESAGERTERRVVANIQVTGPSQTFGTGRMEPDEIAKVVRMRLKAVKSCYERELKKDPKLAGKIVIQFTIGEIGRVTSSKVASSTMSNPNVGRCILARMEQWRFPQPKGGSVTVSYPFVFTASQ
ncbi:MAG: energy transducer TonB [Deltaproteobacteria bacterium]|nr:energy transducer TonB [Deltaproteobacteria bacterium]